MAGGGEEEAARLMVGSGEELQRSHFRQRWAGRRPAGLCCYCRSVPSRVGQRQVVVGNWWLVV